MLVVDGSLVVAALIDAGREGTWADGLLGSDALAAPHLMPVEVANILRRAVASGELTADTASMAHADLLALRIDLYPYGPFSPRVWELRDNVTCYDAWYVALAEALDAPLATLDVRLSRAAGPRCRFQLPPPG
ncbi:MAG TPA: type II toxin-antitoxin system VapC family toxin [Myxococcales bacterium]